MLVVTSNNRKLIIQLEWPYGHMATIRILILMNCYGIMNLLL